MVSFIECERSIGVDEIGKVEELVGLRLPKEYKEHLLKYNGGRCEPNEFYFVENGVRTSSCVHFFLAIYDGEYDNLIDYVETYKLEEKRMPQHIFPIAHDPGGNLICLSCGEVDYGCAYFWNHEMEVDYKKSSDNDYSNLYLIEKSFDQFIKSLK